MERHQTLAQEPHKTTRYHTVRNIRKNRNHIFKACLTPLLPGVAKSSIPIAAECLRFFCARAAWCCWPLIAFCARGALGGSNPTYIVTRDDGRPSYIRDARGFNAHSSDVLATSFEWKIYISPHKIVIYIKVSSSTFENTILLYKRSASPGWEAYFEHILCIYSRNCVFKYVEFLRIDGNKCNI